jgi:hypothetical protein
LISELEKKYNAVLARAKKAEAYLDDESKHILTRQRYIKDYQKVVHELEAILKEIKFYEPENVLMGFSLDATVNNSLGIL